MDRKVLARKIIVCLAALGSAFLFFCFLGKAYGNEGASPSWYDLIFGGQERNFSSDKLDLIRRYEPTPAGIALFSLTIASGIIGLWIFAASLTHERSNVPMCLGLTSIHAMLLLLGLALCSFVLPIFVPEGMDCGLGAGSVIYIALASIFLCLDLVGLFLLIKEKRRG